MPTPAGFWLLGVIAGLVGPEPIAAAPVAAGLPPSLAVVADFVEQVWNEDRPDLAGAYLADRYRVSTQARTLDWMRWQIEACRRLFPDLCIEIDDLFGEDDQVVVRCAAVGTLKGAYASWPGNGRPVRIPGAAWLRLQDGLIVEIRYQFDRTSLMHALDMECTLPDSAPGGHGCIVGRIFNDTNGAPLRRAEIAIVGLDNKADTVALGDAQFLLHGVPSGMHALRASCVGYDPKTLADIPVRSGETTSVEVRLHPGTCCLGDVVTVRRHTDSGSEESTRWHAPEGRAASIASCIDAVKVCLEHLQPDHCLQPHLSNVFSYRNAGATIAVQGLGQVEKDLAMLGSAFTDARLSVSYKVATEDRAAVFWELRGIFSGDFAGIQGDGREIFASGITIAKWSDGQAVEAWSLFDRVALFQQLGFIWASAQMRWDTR